MADPQITLTTTPRITTSAELKPVAVEDVLAFEVWVQEQARQRGGETRLTSGERLIVLDYIYWKWQQPNSGG